MVLRIWKYTFPFEDTFTFFLRKRKSVFVAFHIIFDRINYHDFKLSFKLNEDSRTSKYKEFFV